jgi:hypothetical protein
MDILLGSPLGAVNHLASMLELRVHVPCSQLLTGKDRLTANALSFMSED